MLAEVIRSGVVEATIEGAVAVVEPSGALIASDGDIDRTYYFRSAVKPFQALAALSTGAQFTPEELAIACASHAAQPIHIAYVESMLAADGLDASALHCPPDWPDAPAAHQRLVSAGHRLPERRWHNCSGKHAGMLRACVAAGWPVESYLDADHPLQVRIREVLSEAIDAEPGVPGVDGCGAPVYAGSTRQLALAFARLATDPAYEPVRTAMHRHGSLTADGLGSDKALDSAPSRYWDVAAKGGAEGCIGLAVRGRFGVALKCFDGSSRALGPAMLDTMEQLDVAPSLMKAGYRQTFEEPVTGGGRVVGQVESRVSLR